MPRLRSLPMDSRYRAANEPGGARTAQPRAMTLAVAAGAATGVLGGLAESALAQAAPGGQPPQGAPVIRTNQLLNLRVRRQGAGVDVVIEGVGLSPELQQTTRGSVWMGRLLTARPAAVPGGSQRLSVPEAGFQSLSLAGVGQVFELQITPIPGYPLGLPVVSADGRDLILSFAASSPASQQSVSRDQRMPGRVSEPNAAYVPPLQPRAVAPPVGDMAVGTMLLTNSSYLNVSGPPVTMTLKNAPARDVLMALSRMGGYGFVFVEDSSKADNGASSTLPISISFRNENYGQALNSALLAAGLQAKRQGNTIMAGPNVMGKSFGSQLSKVYRLNQVNANSAADYLANLGAVVNKTNTISTAITEGANPNTTAVGASNLATTTASRQTKVESYSAGSGPLQGLIATTDSRLSTITLVGEPRLVMVAESYLRQLDLRQRQVALSVKILDVSLGNNATFENSFAVRWGNNFIVNDQGQMVGAFGSLLPPTSDAFGRSYPTDVTIDASEGKVSGSGPTGYNINGGAQFGDSLYPARPDASIFKDVTKRNPGLSYYPNNFYNFVNATIQSSNTKVLSSPTLILSENSDELRKGEDTQAISVSSLATGTAGSTTSSGGTDSGANIGRTKANESYVTVGEQVITNYTVTNGTQGNGNSCQPTFGIAGLTFGARVSKIDDNGFVTFSMSPAITAALRQQVVPGCGPIDILAVRRLDTGSARVRDGQTLIMTGVISDADRQEVSKWPILGDVPIIGQFFRSSNNNRAKRELVILVTPRIINDTEGGNYGYGYQPGTNDTRRFLADPNAPLLPRP